MRVQAAPSRLRVIRGYLIAVMLSILVLCLRMALGPLLGELAPLSVFTLAVAIAATVGGLGPGLLATALGAVLGILFFIPPYGFFGIQWPEEALLVGLFIVTGVLISVLGHRMRRSIVRAEQAVLQEALLVASTITDNASEAFFILDEPGLILFANTTAMAWVARGSQSALGQPLHDLLHPHDEPGVPCPLHDAIAGRHELAPTETVLSRRDGTVFPALCAVRIIHRPYRPMTMFVEIRDITREKSIEQDRERMLARERAARIEISRASRMKDELMDMVSHELRTPLTPILGWVQLMRREAGLSPQVERGLRIIERNAQIQEHLVSDLLDASRASAGKLRLEKSVLSIEAVIQAAIDSVRFDIEAKAIQVETKLEPLSAPICGDASRLQQLFWNILTNAIKFVSRGGHIEISLSAKEGLAEISVKDDGRGMGPEELPHVFDRFWQASSSSTRNYRGLGLGLTIVQHIVMLHGGRVRAESEGLGKGTRFVVELPYDGTTLEGCEEMPQALEAPQATLRDICVLVVEDEPDVLEFIRRVLEEAGAHVLTANSAADALALLSTSTHLPSVLVSDIGMPGMDGYEMIKEHRRRRQGNTIPALALTAFSRAEDLDHAIQAGFREHLTKPVEPDVLREAVARLASTSKPN